MTPEEIYNHEMNEARMAYRLATKAAWLEFYRNLPYSFYVSTQIRLTEAVELATNPAKAELDQRIVAARKAYDVEVSQ